MLCLGGTNGLALWCHCAPTNLRSAIRRGGLHVPQGGFSFFYHHSSLLNTLIDM